ncbi:hypothetical protein GS432_12140 [Rhodococcus hoagii]|nr:hypothetical protein [Prescottella equi]
MLDLIVLTSESGIAVVDKFNDVVLVNPRAEELGWSATACSTTERGSPPPRCSRRASPSRST